MKLSRTLCVGVCAFLLLGWLHATAQMTATAATPLTMQQAVEMALRQNPTLLAAQRNLESIRAEEITARLRQNPVFSLSGTDITLPANNPSNPYSYAGNVSRLFERGQKRRWRLESARASTQVTESQYHDLERQTVLAVKNAFTNMLLANAALQLADNNLTSYRKVVDLTTFVCKQGRSAKPILIASICSWPASSRTTRMRRSTWFKAATSCSNCSALKVPAEISRSPER